MIVENLTRLSKKWQKLALRISRVSDSSSTEFGQNLRLENELDGVYILRTREKDLNAEEIIESYKDLQDVERAFRSLKSPLELRPFYHHKEERVRGHVLRL